MAYSRSNPKRLEDYFKGDRGAARSLGYSGQQVPTPGGVKTFGRQGNVISSAGWDTEQGQRFRALHGLMDAPLTSKERYNKRMDDAFKKWHDVVQKEKKRNVSDKAVKVQVIGDQVAKMAKALGPMATEDPAYNILTQKLNETLVDWYRESGMLYDPRALTPEGAGLSVSPLEKGESPVASRFQLKPPAPVGPTATPQGAPQKQRQQAIPKMFRNRPVDVVKLDSKTGTAWIADPRDPGSYSNPVPVDANLLEDRPAFWRHFGIGSSETQ